MKILLFSFITILMFSFCALGQEINPCRESDSPIIQGLRLDTSLADIKKDSKLNFNKAKNFKNLLGVEEYTYEFLRPNKAVDILYLTFYKDKLYRIYVAYSNEVKWYSLKEFQQQIIDTLALSGFWVNIINASGDGKEISKLSCVNFYVQLKKDKNDYSLMADSEIILKRKTKDYRENFDKQIKTNIKKKEEFKP